MNRILTLTTRFISVCFLIFNKPHFESHRFGLVASAPRTCLLSRVLWDLGVAAFSLPPRFRLLTDDWFRPVLKRWWVCHGICCFEISKDPCLESLAQFERPQGAGIDSISVNYSELPAICWELPLLNVYCDCECVKCDWHFFGTGKFLGACFWVVKARGRGWSLQGRVVPDAGWPPSLKREWFIKNHDGRFCETFFVPLFKHYHINFLFIKSM